MIQRFRNAGLVWPTVLMIVGLAVLANLGAWQWSRMHWKEGLIGAIKERTQSAPIAFAELDTTESGDVRREYLRVVVSGLFRHDLERHVYQLGREGPGWHVFTPLLLDGKKTAVWVNRGYVPDALKAPDARPNSQPAGTVQLVGLYRLANRPGFFVPEADPALNIWYAPDTRSMSETAPKLDPVAEYYFDAERSGGGWPRGGTTNLTLTNKHFGYAMTWWGLALTLIGVYVAFAIQRLTSGAFPRPDASPGEGLEP